MYLKFNIDHLSGVSTYQATDLAFMIFCIIPSMCNTFEHLKLVLTHSKGEQQFILVFFSPDIKQ